jgi:hypothetical protein
MKIRMKVYVSGTHDGVDWPRIGDVAEVDDEVGADMCAHGLADPVAVKGGKVEKAVVDDEAVEERDGEPPRGGPGSGRDEWAAYAELQGVDVTDDMTRDEIIEALEG